MTKGLPPCDLVGCQPLARNDFLRGEHVANSISRCDFAVGPSLNSVTFSGLPTALQTNFKRSPYRSR